MTRLVDAIRRVVCAIRGHHDINSSPSGGECRTCGHQTLDGYARDWCPTCGRDACWRCREAGRGLPPTARCDNCLYYVNWRRCRRNAPLPNYGWAIAEEDGWCGEYVRAEQREE